MTDQDRLADIKAHAEDEFQRTAHGGDGYRVSINEIFWLVGEVERLNYLTLVARRDIERLRGLLARLEWSGTVVFDEWYDKGRCCPACRAEQGDPHAPDCWLAAELGNDEAAVPKDVGS